MFAKTTLGVPECHRCNGENHRENCPVELTRQDLIAALDKFDAHKVRILDRW